MLLELHPVYPYSYLKAALIEIFGQTEEHQLDQLLHACDLGDREPTELLAEMRKLLGTKGSPVLLKKLFMDRFPSDVWRVFVVGPMDNLDDVARRADRVLAEDRNSDPDPRFVSASNKLLADKVNGLAKLFNSFWQQHPAQQTVTLQINSFAPAPMALTNRDSNFQRPSFPRPRFSSTPYRGPRRDRFFPAPRSRLGDLRNGRKPQVESRQQHLASYMDRHLRSVAIMIEVTNRRTECTQFNLDDSQMSTVALQFV